MIFEKLLTVSNGILSDLKCLESFNFGPDFVCWVKTFYKNIKSCIINNGTISDFFTLERGVRQGDPLSPYLFVLAAETLAISVRQNIKITGITIGREETKLLQYADDMTATLSDINSLKALLDLLEVHKNASGLTINCTKTEAMWIASLRNKKIKPLDLKWPDEPIKALGVYYSYDEKIATGKEFYRKS